MDTETVAGQAANRGGQAQGLKLDHSPRIIDCMYQRPRVAAAFLREEGGELAFVEANTARALPLLLGALAESGHHPEEVRYLIVTHAHLDHAGGAFALMEACPNATLVAHPRAARHLVDPAKLEAGTRRVYGDEVFEALYGELRPVPAERVITPEDGASIPFGSGKLLIMHTRGHAKHHLAVLDPLADAVYTGDAFGLFYPELQERGLFIFPSSSPTDFEGAEALAAVDRIAAAGAGRVMLSHFGELREIAAARVQLRRHLEASIEIAGQARSLPEVARQPFILGKLRLYYDDALAIAKDGFLDKDLELNADGLAWSIREA
ncbi:MAG: MBL fold metallo-hydrolase [Spirochaetota bacterium]